LILCSGGTLTKLPPASEVAAATLGTPVLFEVSNGKGASWILSTASQSIVLRKSQMLTRHDQKAKQVMLARMIAEEKGIVQFQGVSTNFVLLICGDNNCLSYNRRRSVLRNAPTNTGARLKTLLNDWVVLNPAHRPYWPQIKSTGFVKVGQDRRGSGPTLKRLIKQKWQYKDGSCAPTALIHCNNYDLDRKQTQALASRSFGANKAGKMRVSETGAWQFVTYSFDF
jgi:hypothetical protein